ncbi:MULTISPECIES: low molecular weight protein-tyrosine-phosphatase [unclassified Janibacter]|uniref:low molecular weight protein-tyrosine-phosphatase n=1 Tax=unclassified Janibacter TaxID=2649294 RepID=UPI003D009CD2
MYRICVVCTGNICRSPMGEFILRELFEEAGLGDRVHVDSAGTTAWEEGNPADPRTLAVLARNGHEGLGGDHVARVFRSEWLAERDLVLAADHGHLGTLRRMARTEDERAKVAMFRSFDQAGLREDQQSMDDPWYGDDRDFDRTYAEVMGAARGVVDHVRRELDV